MVISPQLGKIRFDERKLPVVDERVEHEEVRSNLGEERGSSIGWN
jgi:hypothetical protein